MIFREYSLVAQMVKNLCAKMWENWVQFLDQEDPLEKGMATHSSILRTSLVAQMVGKKKKSACSAEFHGQRSLVSYSLWDCKE